MSYPSIESEKTRLKDVQAINDITNEVARARELHEPMNSAHEAYSVILEELDEFWEIVKMKRDQRRPEDMYKELIQTAAMCVRAASDLNLIQ